MKSIAILFLCLVTRIQAQTNFITFTNKSGEAVINAEVLTFNAIDVFYKTPSGGDRVHLADLPSDIQFRFGYDRIESESAAKAEEARKKQLAIDESNFEIAANQLRADQESRRLLEKTKMCVEGRIIQRLETGLLVESASRQRDNAADEPRSGYNSSGAWTTGYSERSWFVDGLPLYDGLCLLTDAHVGFIDGDTVKAACYPNGTYEYTTVSGGGKTVRKFTTNPALVINPASSNEMKVLTQPRPVL